MRARALLIPFVAFFAASFACAREGPPASEFAATAASSFSASSQMRLFGRYDVQDTAGPRLAWSSSGAAVRFRGKQLDVRLRDPGGLNAFQIVVDGSPVGVLATHAAQERYTLVKAIADGEHELILVKRTEARVGEVQLLGFVAPDGSSLLSPPQAPARRIEVIGDSITAGYGNEGESEHCRFSPSTENAYMTYAAITARALGAELSALAWSGKTVDGMAELYDRALPARADSRWDTRAWVPDAVVINLGTNDVTGYVGQGPFVASYVKLVERIRAQYPKALVVCIVGPMLTDIYPPGRQTLTRARAWVRRAVETKRSAGDGRVVFLEVPAQEAANGYGCDYHPSVRTHQLVADRLSALLRSELGW